MPWEFVVALVIAIPIILFPAVFIWYLNLGWILSYVKQFARERRATAEKGATIVAQEQLIEVKRCEE